MLRTRLPEYEDEADKQNQQTRHSRFGRVIVHQANYRIIEALQERTGIPADRWTVNIGRVGNMAAASMPLALVDALENNELSNGDLVLCAGFGGGLTWAGMLVEW